MDMASRLARINRRIDSACTAAGRKRDEVTLIAVSKTHPLEAVLEAARLGQTRFGESYMQEALSKQTEFYATDSLDAAQKSALEWHYIGHMQSRKARDAAGRFALIHSLHSPRLAQALHKRMEQLAEGELSADLVNTLAFSARADMANFAQPVLIQVNIGQEEQKSGIMEADLPALIELVLGLPRLRLNGLMCIPPFEGGPETARPYFARLRALRDEMEARFGKGSLPELSMGMSQDFELAIAEGATLVRVGTDIFGERNYA